ncbi:nitrite reductase/ring-hydroxylating ferredoxin subunit [Pseudomonas sp. BT76 TE3572]|nr:Rieske 2Fe-2S domain-containing protein [Pseudomonas mandelii]
MSSHNQIYPTQSRFPFSSYPCGWYGVAWVDDIENESITSAKLCGKDIVIVSTLSGLLAVYDAHCPHLGAHLGFGGTVVGENVRCPFHGWEFDGGGLCSRIPYYENPMKVGLKKWYSLVHAGMLQVWYSDAAEEPLWQPDPVEVEGWTKPVLREDCEWTLRTHVQEVAENGVDVAHFTTVHNAEAIGEIRNLSLAWPLANWTSVSSSDIGGKSSIAEASVVLDGLGLHKVQVKIDDSKIEFRSFLYVSPYDLEQVVIRMTVSVKDTGDSRKNNMLIKYLIPRLATELAKDFDIWENKKYIERPPLSRVDGPIGKFRIWCRDFYG